MEHNFPFSGWTFHLFWKFSGWANQNGLTIYSPTEISVVFFFFFFFLEMVNTQCFSFTVSFFYYYSNLKMILKLVMILKNDFSAKVIFILFTAGMITCNVNMLTCMLTRLYDDNMQCWHDNKMEILNGIINVIIKFRYNACYDWLKQRALSEYRCTE